MPKRVSHQGGSFNPTRDFPAERRDTASAIRLWHQKAAELGQLPPITAFDFSRLKSDCGYRFLISGDEFIEASVFLVYGAHFARLLGLPQKPISKMPLLQQLPERYRPVFVGTLRQRGWERKHHATKTSPQTDGLDFGVA